MRPTSSQSSHWEGRPSTHVVPKQSLGTRVHCPRPHFLVEGLAYTEGTMCGSDCSELSHCDLEKAEDVVFGEVADWLMLDESDDISTSQKCNLRAFLPSRQGIKYATVANKPANSTTNGSVLPEGLLYFIALQLLASCYTVIPASNADSLPICRQRRTKELVTSLRLHSRYRFSPASGHSARPPSEASSWPGLYAGPTLEDRLADTVSNQRLFSRGKGEHGHDVPVVELAESYISTREWSDGPATQGTSDTRKVSQASTSSTTSSNIGLLAKLMCYYPRPANSIFQPRQSAVWRRASQAIQNLPSTLGLRRTHSTPQLAQLRIIPNNTMLDRRKLSHPMLINPPTFPLSIPEIRRISATTMGEWSVHEIQSGRFDGMLSAPITHDESTSNPFDAMQLERDRRASFCLNGISPLTSTPTVGPGLEAQYGGYFGKAKFESQEACEGDGQIEVINSEDSESSNVDTDNWSEDSISMLGKRKGTVFGADDFGLELGLKTSIRGVQ